MSQKSFNPGGDTCWRVPLRRRLRLIDTLHDPAVIRTILTHVARGGAGRAPAPSHPRPAPDLRDLKIRAEVPPEARRRSRTGRELRAELLAELEHGRVSRPRRRIRGRELKAVWLDVDAEEGRDRAWSSR